MGNSVSSSANPCAHGQVEGIFDRGLVPMTEAAAALGVDVRRLRGWVFRDSVAKGDPIGSVLTDEVYGWSLRSAIERGSVAPEVTP